MSHQKHARRAVAASLVTATAAASAVLLAPAASAASTERFCGATAAYLDHARFDAVDNNDGGVRDGIIGERNLLNKAFTPVGYFSDPFGISNVDYEGIDAANYILFEDEGAWRYIETRKGEYTPDGGASYADFVAGHEAQCG